MRRYNLKDFELSQAYLFFWDKLEKANYLLENILDTTEEEVDSRLVKQLLSDPVGDGGQWDMAANLVEKYGLVGTTTNTSLEALFDISIYHRSHRAFIQILRTP